MDNSLMTKVARAMELAILDGAIKATNLWIKGDGDLHMSSLLFTASIGAGISAGLEALDDKVEKTMGKRPGFFTRGIGDAQSDKLEKAITGKRDGQEKAEKTVSDVEAATHVEGTRDTHTEVPQGHREDSADAFARFIDEVFKTPTPSLEALDDMVEKTMGKRPYRSNVERGLGT
jgi:hypothetical protein